MLPVVDLTEENLERRIQRIRERDEEIEKKHREAEEDRLHALKMNAMVQVKSASDTDWPRAHKYDAHDFEYDVEEEDDAAATSPASSETNVDIVRPKRVLKKGYQGPPADPTYNFLADAERDRTPKATQAAEEWDHGSGTASQRKHNRNLETRTRKQLTNDDSPKKQREKAIEPKAKKFPAASRVVGPLKLVGSDYNIQERSKNATDVQVNQRNSASNQNHSKAVESK